MKEAHLVDMMFLLGIKQRINGAIYSDVLYCDMFIARHVQLACSHLRCFLPFLPQQFCQPDVCDM